MIAIDLRKTLRSGDREMPLDVNISVERGTFVALTGHSGSGKTTLLRMIAGLTRPESGSLRVGGTAWYESRARINLRPEDRSIGFVFQEYALFPNMTAAENISYACRDSRRVSELLEMMELEDLRDRYPRMLSWGQRQRVALARAIAREPEILLLDEPLSALDSGLRRRLQDELLKIHRRFGSTIILVSHDTTEMIRLCSRALILDRGKIIGDGAPLRLFSESPDPERFFLSGRIMQVDETDGEIFALVSLGEAVIRVKLSREELEAMTGTGLKPRTSPADGPGESTETGIPQ